MEKKMLSLEVPDELREALRQRAFIEKKSISKLIRQILEEQLKAELEQIQANTQNSQISYIKEDK